ncbi:helix-hairpin-helix domain-containing protein [Streptomyces sp. NPDC057623]|uniref:helix-hairpin-helix domain-containing protein n=1 Tax=Streptomyces sp. NPDC057623 TaxID=3346187 RepID=UPI0036C9E9C4
MALRSRTRTATVSSGPGRGPHSDGRTRHRSRLYVRGRARQRHASAAELRRRAEVIFAERAVEWRESGAGPPPGEEGHAPGAGVRETPASPVGVGESGEDLSGGRRVRPDVRVGDRYGDWSEGLDVPEADIGAGAGAGAGVGSGTGDADAGVWRSRAGSALRERMPVWLQARCGLERRSVVALTVVLVLAAGFAVQHFWAGRAQSVRAPEVVRAAAAYGGEQQGGKTEPGMSTGGASGASGTAAPEIVVDVSGKVREPGIHRLPAGSRVADALRAAGGVRPGTKTDSLNRARFLVDGEQVIVGDPAAVPGGAPGTGAGAGAIAGAAPTAPVSLNTATVDQLDTLPGVGPVLAQHIIDYRTQHSGFRSVDELREVNGIGDRRFADLRNLVRP